MSVATAIHEMANRQLCKSLAASALGALFATFAASAATADDNASSVYKALKPSLALIASFKDDKLVAVGSGFCVSSAAGISYFVTNRHVIAGGNRVTVIREYPKYQQLIGQVIKIGSGAKDLALIKIKGGMIPPVKLADEEPDEGTRIGVAGYPRTQIILGGAGMGLTASLHTGTVNALPAGGFYIQYDAQTEPGNSGGPLFDISTGDIYGIVVLKIGQRESNLAISVTALSQMASNARVALSIDSSGSSVVASASPEPTAVAQTPSVDSDCTAALSQFDDAYNQWSESFNRYVQASSRTTSGSAGVTTRLGMIGPQMSVGYEMKAIRSAINAEEPKIQTAQALIDSTKARDTAELTNDIMRQVQQIDQNSLSWTSQRMNLLNNVAAGGAGFQVDQSLLQAVRTGQAAVNADFDKLKYSPMCKAST